MGGIIVVDFIDMKEEKNRLILTEKLKEFMRKDKAKHNVLPPTKFGFSSNYKTKSKTSNEY